ncbi:unnamed protein product [Phytophthora fragariaefolia]|uniref:Unnamed protein product n=1 Tax=Phytophthora fragariaefolia TaxID=1490495 RepID=A0A9W6WSR1_9STRA|nr:unnamed protein product [Phytophthora fragariaefolia]
MLNFWPVSAMQARTLVTAKTVAGSGRKVLPRQKAKSPHEEFISDDNDDDEEDEDYEPDAGEVDAEDGHAEVEVAPPLKPAKARRKSRAKLQSKSTKPRKLTAAQLAKQAKESRLAASELRCIEVKATPVEEDTAFAQDDSVSEQANTMANSSDGHLESPPSQNGEYEVLTSDCEDTETEIGFYDDDEELQRAKAARLESKRGWRQMHDECGGDTAYDETDDFDDESGSSGSESDCDEEEGEDVGAGSGGPCATETTSAESSEHRPARNWREVRKDEMSAFAQDDENMMDMRASGWEFGTGLLNVVIYNKTSLNHVAYDVVVDPAQFPPDARYPNLWRQKTLLSLKRSCKS